MDVYGTKQLMSARGKGLTGKSVGSIGDLKS